MSELSKELVKSFAQAMNADVGEPPRITVYGTIKETDSGKYVQVDGSDQYTPITEVTEALDGDRVLLTIENHTAIILGNFTIPTSARDTIDALEKAEIALEEIEGHDEALDEIQNSISTAVNNANTALEYANATKEALYDTERHLSNVEKDLEDALDSLEDAEGKAQAAYDAALSANSNYEIVNGVVTEIQNEFTEAREDMEEFAKELENWEQTMNAEFVKETELTEYKNTLESSIQQSAAQIELRVKGVEETTVNMTTQVEGALTASTNAQNAAQEAQNAASAAQANADSAQASATHAASEAEQARKDASAAADYANAADQRLSDAEAELTNAQNKLEELTERADVTTEELEEARKEVEDATAKVEQAQKDAALANATATEAERKAGEAQQAADDAQAAADAAQADASQALADAKAAQDLANELGTTVSEHDAWIELNDEKIQLAVTEEYVTTALNGYVQEGDLSSAIEATSKDILLSVSGSYQTKEAMKDYYTVEQTNAQILAEAGKITQSVESTYATKKSLEDEVDAVEKSISKVEQTADQIKWIVASGDSSSNMTLTDDFFNLVTKDIEITADNIDLHGYITANGDFSIDQSGSMTAKNGTFSGDISGSTITGGTIIGPTIQNAASNPSFKVTPTGTVTGATIIGPTIQNAVSNPSFQVTPAGKVTGASINGGSILIGNKSGNSHFEVDTSGVMRVGHIDQWNHKAILTYGNSGLYMNAWDDANEREIDVYISGSGYEIGSTVYGDSSIAAGSELQMYCDVKVEGDFDCTSTIHSTRNIQTDTYVKAGTYVKADTYVSGTHFNGDGIRTETDELTLGIRGATVYNVNVGEAEAYSARLKFRYNGSDYYFHPHSSGKVRLGAVGSEWSKAYIADVSNISGSDRRIKTNISYYADDVRYENMFMELKPCTFQKIDNEFGRHHSGFIAQEVEDSMNNNGLDYGEFAALVKVPVDDKGEELNYNDKEQMARLVDYRYNIRYGEFTALNTHMIQKALNKIDQLEAKIAELERKLEETK